MRKDIREPTPDECSTNTFIVGLGMAAWYPQMGGYTGKCIIVPLGGCFDVYVWHDGEFPFSDGKGPVRLHHCDADQFERFAEVARRALDMEEHGYELPSVLETKP